VLIGRFLLVISNWRC